MASRTVGLIRDQDLNVHYSGKTNITKAPKKGGIGVRKPLGDLSNSLKPTPSQAKKENSKNVSLDGKETGASKLTFESSKKKSVSKASDKVQAGGRKALSDISNSGKPSMQEITKKNQTAKLSILAEDDPSLPKDIAEEGFLHNHEQCIKAQRGAMSLNQFLQMLALADFSKECAYAKETIMSNKIKPMSSPRCLKPGEMPELLIEDLSPPRKKLSSRLDSAPASPEPLDYYAQWDDAKYVPSFNLLESP